MVRQLARPAFQLAMGLVRDREAAEDIVQEAFLRAMQNRRTPHIAEEFRLWLYRVIVNLVRDHQRRRARAPARPLGHAFDRSSYRGGTPDRRPAAGRSHPAVDP